MTQNVAIDILERKTAPAESGDWRGRVNVWCMSESKNLMVKCPTTGKVADTGFTMSAEELEAATLVGNAFECGHCFEFHAWTKADLLQDA